MMSLLRSLALGAALLAATPPAFAGDAEDVQAAISGQLGAFRAEKGEEAYSYAAPNIRQMFSSPEIFMRMVKSAYDPVYRSSNAAFGKLAIDGGVFRQEVYLTDRNGQSWIASYTLSRQPDGSMKITGCAIRKGDDVSA
ncbi:DUF4864 domain-containing protein [Mangrovicella endophytica]|uniref:DUF4864 domain-containing protein n=1 Tax=Mangrovicella endophytica TaxID=2066697 RepID=UPI000C9E8352|nr:DUF4864 domain-containing protein [Mangrovicella endophytica]